MDESKRRRLLTEAVQDAMAPRDGGPPPRRSRRPRTTQQTLLFLVLLGWAVLAWIWTARPAAIFSSRAAARPVSAAQREASLRYAIYLQRHEIADYARQHGRLPATLVEVELDPSAGLVLEHGEGGGWAVVGTQGEVALRLTDRMNADSFLGSSLITLAR